MPRKKRLLVITHETSATGAPILLLNLLGLIKEAEEYDISLIAVKPGNIMDKFRQFGTIGRLKADNYRHETSKPAALWNLVNFIGHLFMNLPRWYRADIVVGNTIGNGKIYKFFLSFFKRPVISYIHELEETIKRIDEVGESTLTFQLSAKLLACSPFNRDVLINVFGNPASKVEVLNYYIPDEFSGMEEAELRRQKMEAKQAFCIEHNLPEDTMLVLGMGTVDARKGVDYFIQTAEKMEGTNICFCWIGASRDRDYVFYLEQMGIGEHVKNFKYLGAKMPDARNYLPFDVLFLSSREDPYPLVVLEAALALMPVVSFRSGGSIDFIGNDSGWIVDGFSTDKVAQLLNTVIPVSLQAYGSRARQKALRVHTDGKAIYQKFASLVEEVS